MNTTDLATELRALTYSVASLRAETVSSYLTYHGWTWGHTDNSITWTHTDHPGVQLQTLIYQGGENYQSQPYRVQNAASLVRHLAEIEGRGEPEVLQDMQVPWGILNAHLPKDVADLVRDTLARSGEDHVEVIRKAFTLYRETYCYGHH